ncbi:MAG: DNA repair protein RecO [Fluviicola sp.]|nr:DNA repair protein RecO [Fluviicola sp.]
MKTTDDAIFIHRSSYSSSSLLTTFFTKKHGLQKFIFKGGKKKAHNIFPLAISEITYYGRNEDLLNLTNVESKFPQELQFNPIKSTIAFFVVELIDKCLQKGDSDERLYFFLENTIIRLEEAQQLELFPLEFLIGFCDKLGIRPLLEDNKMCFFNIDSGVFQHTSSDQLRTFSGDEVELIKNLLNQEEIIEVPPKKTRTESMKIMINYFKTHVSSLKKLDSYEILKEVLS